MAKKIKTKKTKAVKKRKKEVVKVDKGIVHVHSSFNNIIVNLTDHLGNSLAWASAGALGFKGTKKSTPFAAAQTARQIVEKAKSLGLSQLEIKVRGVGAGRESAIRSFAGSGINVTTIKDVTPIPHGGVRPKKARRV